MTGVSERIGFAAALTAATAYGINIIGARLSADAGIAAPLLVLFRVALMAALVGGYGLLRQQRLQVATGEWPAIIILVLTTAGMGICYLSSVAYIPVTVAAVIFYTYPVMIVLAAPVFAGETLQARNIGVALLAFIGIIAVVGPSFDKLDWRGLAFAFGAAMLTVGQFFAAARASKTTTLAKIYYIQLGVIPIAFAVAYFSDALAAPDIVMRAPFGFALATLGYLIGFGAQMLALSHLRASIASLVFCLEPVVAAVCSAAMLGERLSALQYAGGALVISAVMITVLVRGRRSETAPA